MEGYSMSVKMKRKDLEQVYDDFSDFSLSSPARKIRRLDVELPPIIEEEEPVISVTCEPPQATAMEGSVFSSAASKERALVLYKPVNTPVLQSSGPHCFSFKVNKDLIPDLHNHVKWAGCASVVREVREEEEDETLSESGESKGCMAVVPWVPSQQQHVCVGAAQAYIYPSSKMGLSAPSEEATMEAEEEAAANEAEESIMEVEGENEEMPDVQLGEGAEATAGGEVTPPPAAAEASLQQWQQPHCMTPQLPQSASSPIMWSW